MLEKFEDILIDFSGLARKIIINGKDRPPEQHKDKINIKKQYLNLGKNKILIHFENNFSSSSNGFRFWSDPKTRVFSFIVIGRIYVYQS